MGAIRKPTREKAVRVNITLPPSLFHAGVALVKTDYYSSFADLVQGLIRERLKREGAAHEPTT